MVRGTLLGVAVLSNTGEKVVGMPCFSDSSASWSIRAMVMSSA